MVSAPHRTGGLALLLHAMLIACAGAQDAGLEVTLEATRTTVFDFQTVTVTVTFENRGSAASQPIDRAAVLGARNFLCAPVAWSGSEREGSWARLVGAHPTGRVDPLLSGESFTSRVELRLPASLTAKPGAIGVQWTGKVGERDLSSAEIQIVVRQGQHPVAHVRTTEGEFWIELAEDKAPNHVASFIHLSRKGFFDGLTFHRVWPGFVAQTGSPDGSPTGGAGYHLAAEITDTPFKKGVVGLASIEGKPASGSSQWFVCLADALALNGKYTAFGKVLEGQEVVDRIGRLPTDGKGRPAKPAKVLRVTVGTPKGYELPAVKKAGATAAGEPASRPAGKTGGKDGR